jgi:hypothetical protein
MIPLRSIPTLAISIAALAFVAWIASLSLGSAHLYADRSLTQDATAVARVHG